MFPNQCIIQLIKQDPIMACFIREAIIEKAKAVIDDGLPEWPEHHIIAREAWLNVAKQIIETLA